MAEDALRALLKARERETLQSLTGSAPILEAYGDRDWLHSEGLTVEWQASLMYVVKVWVLLLEGVCAEVMLDIARKMKRTIARTWWDIDGLNVTKVLASMSRSHTLFFYLFLFLCVYVFLSSLNHS